MPKHDKPKGLPNLRKMFIPDPGFVMIELDLERSDAHVVAWEADDAELKRILRAREDIHYQNALDIFGPPVGDRERDDAKVGVHAVDYVCAAPTLAEHIGSTRAKAQAFIDRWFSRHPGILKWQRRVELDLLTRRCVQNIFGYKRHYFGSPEKLLPDACAWIGQSTTAIVCHKGLKNIRKKYDKQIVQLLNEDHDSILFQIPEKYFPDLVLPIAKDFEVIAPYPDPMLIAVGIKYSFTSWGELEKFKHEEVKKLAPVVSGLHGGERGAA